MQLTVMFVLECDLDAKEGGDLVTCDEQELARKVC